MFVTKELKNIPYGPSYPLQKFINLESGLEVKLVEPEGQRVMNKTSYWLNVFPTRLFPLGSIERHDAIHYGILLNDDQVIHIKEVEIEF